MGENFVCLELLGLCQLYVYIICGVGFHIVYIRFLLHRLYPAFEN